MTSIRSVNWTLALLKQNPFSITPPRRPEEAVWAGMPRLRSQFVDLFTEALTTSTTQIVLNRGAFGSGKSHAAVFFGIRDRLPPVQGTQVKDALILSVRNPKEGSNASEIFYQDIIEAVRLGRLRQTILALIAEHGKQDALEILQDAVQSEALGRAIWLLGLEKRSDYEQLELFNEEKESGEWRRMLEAYFFSQVTKGDLKQLGLSRGITGAQDRFRVLSTVLHSIIGFAPTDDVPSHQRVILWIDEMEDLIYFTARQYNPFVQGLRELIDRLPHYFTLLMNFTLTTPNEWGDITAILGNRLMDRVTHHIYFQEPNQDEAFEYVCELLQQFHTEAPGNQGLPLTYPFTEDALRVAISTLPSCTPRNLNKRCSSIVTKALQQGIITMVGEGIITADFISNLDLEQIEFDLG